LRKKESAVEVNEMYLENGRTMVQGIMVLIFATIAFLVDTTLGLGLVAIMGLLILQSSFTNWCPVDLILRSIGFKKKPEDARS
jgi:hypothetical protein